MQTTRAPFTAVMAVTVASLVSVSGEPAPARRFKASAASWASGRADVPAERFELRIQL